MRFGLTIASAIMVSGGCCFAGTITDTFGQLSSSADCGNDEIQRVMSTGYTGFESGVSGVPEPGPVVMILAGLALLVIGRQWRKRTKSGN